MDVRYPHIRVSLIGEDGNAFSIIGACIKAMRKGGVTDPEIESFKDQAMSGNYDNLLRTCMEWVDVR